MSQIEDIFKRSKGLKARIDRFLPGGIPRYVRCYDDGGDGDRYTAVLTGRAATIHSENCGSEYPYLAMSNNPFQGFGQHGATRHQPCDTIGGKYGHCWPPALGRKNHLGTRIRFQDLPPKCQELVIQDYKEIWRLNPVGKLEAA